MGGRPVSNEEGVYCKTFVIPLPMALAFKEAAAIEGISQSALLRKIISQYLGQHDS